MKRIDVFDPKFLDKYYVNIMEIWAQIAKEIQMHIFLGRGMLAIMSLVLVS